MTQPSPPADSSYDLAAPKEPAPVAYPAAKPQAERVCPHCGHRVFGKTRGNRCPECSAALDLTAADLLQFSSASWLRDISWGPMLMALAVLIHGVGIVVWPISSAIQKGLDAPPPANGTHNATMAIAAHALASLLLFGGTWMFTAHDASASHRGKVWGSLSRWLTLATALLWLSAAIATFAHKPFASWLLISGIAGIAVEAVAIGIYGSQLAARIPHDGLANQFRNIAMLVPAFAAFLIGCQFMDIGEYYKFFFCSFPFIFGLLGFFLWIAATFLRLIPELRDVAKASEAISRRRERAAQKPQ